MNRLYRLFAAAALVLCCCFAGAQDVPVFNLENEVVQKFMSMGTYEVFGSVESYFADNEEFPVKYAQDRPAFVTLKWDGKPGKTFSVVVMEGENVVVCKETSGNEIVIKNLIPQRRYSYIVKSGKKKVAKGEFRTEGLVRMIDIENSCNARDLGGWTGLDGKKIKYGWLYRTGSIDGVFSGEAGENCGGARCKEPNHEAAQMQVGSPEHYELSDTSVEEIEQVGIKADLDLRGVTNEGMWGNQCMPHSRSLGVTMIPGAEFGQIMTDKALYSPLQDDAVVRDVAWIIAELKKGNPVAFHCRSGADRTGALAMLIEALLGVSAGDIARDYELTSLSSEGSGQSRSAKSALRSAYGFFARGFTTLEVEASTPSERLQKQSYAYLNSYFPDCRISEEDLNWFIDFMLE